MQSIVLEMLILAAIAALIVASYRRVGTAVARAVRERLRARALCLHPIVEVAVIAFWPVPLAVLVVPPTIRYVADDLRLIGIAAVDGFVAALGGAARMRTSFALRSERPRDHHGRDQLKTRLAELRLREAAADRDVVRRREDLPCTRCTCPKNVTSGRIDVLRRRIAHARAEGRAAAVRSAANRVEAAIFTYHGRLAIMQRVL